MHLIQKRVQCGWFVLVLGIVSMWCATRAAQLHPVIVVSPPKCGTHLVHRCLELLTTMKADTSHFRRPFHEFSYPSIPVFVDILSKVQAGHFATFHLRFSEIYEPLLQELGYRVIYIYRDPRDQLVSRVRYIKKGGYLDFKFRRLSFERLLLLCIGQPNRPYMGIDSFNHRAQRNCNNLGNIRDLYNDFRGWSGVKCCYTTTFEKLIGARGGGSDELQAQEIRNIAQHIGLEITDEDVARVAAHLFGGTQTFVKGTIESWKEHFTRQHIELFKAAAPTLLQELGYAPF